MLGIFNAEVKILNNETITVDGKPIKVVSNRDPLQLPWAEMGIDIVIEVYFCFFFLIFNRVFSQVGRLRTSYVLQGTGVFVDGPGAGKHIQAGAKKVIITAPAKGADIPTYVIGVNEGDYGHDVANIVRSVSVFTI